MKKPLNYNDPFEDLAYALRPIQEKVKKMIEDHNANKPKFEKDKYGVLCMTRKGFNVWITDKTADKISVTFEIDTELFDINTTREEHPNDPDTDEIQITLDEAVYESDDKDLINEAINLIQIKL